MTPEAKAKAELWWLDLPPGNDRAGRSRSLTWSTGRAATLRYSVNPTHVRERRLRFRNCEREILDWRALGGRLSSYSNLLITRIGARNRLI